MTADNAHDDDDLWGLWMRQAQDGDGEAYHALLRAVTPYLRAITRRYLGPGEDAEDGLQEVLMVVHRIRHTYEPGRPFKPWLGTIASRRCIDLLRRRGHRQLHEYGTDVEVDVAALPSAAPDESLSRLRAAGELRRLVASLPGRQREAIELVRFEELTLREAAARAGQSEGSLKIACHRALKSLRRTFRARDAGHE